MLVKNYSKTLVNFIYFLNSLIHLCAGLDYLLFKGNNSFKSIWEPCI